jgi:hypothetical protein
MTPGTMRMVAVKCYSTFHSRIWAEDDTTRCACSGRCSTWLALTLVMKAPRHTFYIQVMYRNCFPVVKFCAHTIECAEEAMWGEKRSLAVLCAFPRISMNACNYACPRALPLSTSVPKVKLHAQRRELLCTWFSGAMLSHGSLL